MGWPVTPETEGRKKKRRVSNVAWIASICLDQGTGAHLVAGSQRQAGALEEGGWWLLWSWTRVDCWIVPFSSVWNRKTKRSFELRKLHPFEGCFIQKKMGIDSAVSVRLGGG